MRSDFCWRLCGFWPHFCLPASKRSEAAARSRSALVQLIDTMKPRRTLQFDLGKLNAKIGRPGLSQGRQQCSAGRSG